MQKIKELAALEKLSLSEAETAYIEKNAQLLMAGFAALDGIDTAGIEPLVSVLDGEAPLRDDVCAKMLSRETLLDNAPEQHEGYFAVPRTL